MRGCVDSEKRLNLIKKILSSQTLLWVFAFWIRLRWTMKNIVHKWTINFNHLIERFEFFTWPDNAGSVISKIATVPDFISTGLNLNPKFLWFLHWYYWQQSPFSFPTTKSPISFPATTSPLIPINNLYNDQHYA